MAVSKSLVFSILVMIMQANMGCEAFIPALRRDLVPRWNPFDELWQVDPFKILEENPLSTLGENLDGRMSLTRVNWKETPEAHFITLDVPGIKKEDIKIEVEGDVVTVSGESKREEKEESDKWHRVERVEGKFLRRFRLADGHMEGIKASLDNGVLTVNVPKLPKKEAEPKAIPITVTEQSCLQGGDNMCKALSVNQHRDL
ncbi:hypothetical protein SUGI_1008760 [Cryptomeria japonica]|uniref:16.9 kDa class I heat shock protein 1 n=1 Tax=Cryptomeria japonica TaxID=3369 RepID=UPI0024146F68|nr:16.9 kDa class I heat shock protein 1 [Cryptomeria japonica]GLJ47761.1 hypothetical protein SUGI_1008760 [Cryptomeria japonica]